LRPEEGRGTQERHKEGERCAVLHKRKKGGEELLTTEHEALSCPKGRLMTLTFSRVEKGRP